MAEWTPAGLALSKSKYSCQHYINITNRPFTLIVQVASQYVQSHNGFPVKATVCTLQGLKGSVVSAGLLSDVKGLGVTSVSLGKAHGVLLTNKGHVYTFGLNNKGQCGREFVSSGAAKECKLLVSCACLTMPQFGIHSPCLIMLVISDMKSFFSNLLIHLVSLA